ncbi:MAG: hypothetical protein LBS16_06490 [Prevotellaceae bacterium]|jgi:hypothetical protein|nr:hypothetical protein [Prevotellaceae bacterium]
MKNILFSAFMAIYFVFASCVAAQVTIGSGTVPSEIALLELISQDNNPPSGLRLPQLTNVRIQALTSTINQLSDEEKKRANGLLVFNTDINCMMMWNGDSFKSFCGDLAPAEMTLDCSKAKVFPNIGISPFTPSGYQQGKALEGTTYYIEIPVTVTAVGSYDIAAVTRNGYSFQADGHALDVGDQIMRLAGAGTPIHGEPSNYFDELSVRFNQKTVSTCTLPQIPVTSSGNKATFTADCATVSVNGIYSVNTNVTASNSITMNVDVSDPGDYSFLATAGDMSFSRMGKWDGIGKQSVTLLSSGKPTTAGRIPVVINGNSAGGDVVCHDTIPVAYRAIKVAGVGSANTMYHPGGGALDRAATRILTAPGNFSLSGKFPTQGITVTGITNSHIEDALNTNPDILVIGYNCIPSADQSRLLKDYIENEKGVVFLFTQSNPSAIAEAINIICGSSISVNGDGAGGAVFKLLDVDHAILNGPFGDIRQKYWGEDAGTTAHVSAIPDGAIALGDQNTIFVYGNGLLWAGDGGFLSDDEGDNTSKIYYPCKMNADGYPVVNTSFKEPVYNSVLYANAIAWAIEYVMKSRQ